MVKRHTFNPFRPNSDGSQTSHCNIKDLSVSQVMRIENVILANKLDSVGVLIRTILLTTLAENALVLQREI